MVAGRGFEPLKAEPADLQSAPIGRSGNPPLAIEHRNYTDLYGYAVIPRNRPSNG